MLGRRQVEHQISLYQRFIRLVKEDQLLIPMAANVFVVKFAVKVRIDFKVGLILLGPYMLKLGTGRLLRLLTLLREAIGTEEFSFGEGLGPFGYEEVVLEVER